jgi:predicted SAM-dependent methyltransferase
MSRKLHIGGQVKAAGWEVFDANPGPIVDHVANARDLSVFPDHTFERIYASHVVEHFDYNGEMFNDTSDTQLRGVPISLNVIATKAG